MDGAIIENNEFKNTGLKDGIDITYSKNINVTKNDFINMGRSAIFIFWGNQEIKVENNQIKNWMQRYGLYQYYLMERKNIPQENMSDAAIYAYGPANKEISVSNNKITLVDEANGASNPNNTVLENILGSAVFKEKFKQDNADQIPRYTYYSAIRFKGTTDSVAENNYINIPSPDVHHFFAVDERSFATDKGGIKTTTPQNIIFKKNTLINKGAVTFPIRASMITNNIDLVGLTIDNNTFDLEHSFINNYLASMVESRNNSLLTISNNIVKVKEERYKMISVKASPLKELELWGNIGSRTNVTTGDIDNILTLTIDPISIFDQSPYITGKLSNTNITSTIQYSHARIFIDNLFKRQAPIENGSIKIYCDKSNLNEQDRISIELTNVKSKFSNASKHIISPIIN